MSFLPRGNKQGLKCTYDAAIHHGSLERMHDRRLPAPRLYLPGQSSKGSAPVTAAPVAFFQRPYPSANSVLLLGRRPVLVDTGFGADTPALLAWVAKQGVYARDLALVFNTHFHCDHAGGNYALESEFGTPIAAQVDEAVMVNTRDPDACRAAWLCQPVEPYQVTRQLQGGDTVGTGGTAWLVVGTPGHTAGHLSLYSAEHGILVLGDALHDADVGWLNPYREGADSLDRAVETIERLAALPASIGYSGHGPAIEDIPAALDRARRRLASWQAEPERIAWHACKRIFSHALMLTGGLVEAALAPTLLAAPWFRDHAEYAFGLTPDAFVPVLVAEMLRSGAAKWQNGRLSATAAHAAPQAGWPFAPTNPADWPPMVFRGTMTRPPGR
jgi:hydroxyacylglutathione hydrolase